MFFTEFMYSGALKQAGDRQSNPLATWSHLAGYYGHDNQLAANKFNYKNNNVGFI